MIQTEFEHGPAEITEDNVQYWCRHSKELKASQRSKALKFMKADAIRYLGGAMQNDPRIAGLRKYFKDARHLFVCLPLNTKTYHMVHEMNFIKEPYEQDYNHSEYFIFKNKDGNFECNCQGWQTKAKKGEIIHEGANCSHVLALYYCFKIGRFKK